MTPDRQDSRLKQGLPRSSATVGLLGALPPLLLAAAAVAEIGMGRDIPGLLAILLAGVLAILPTLGLRSLLPERRWALPLAAWVWGLALLASLPLYFPADPEHRTLMGLMRLTARMADDGSEALGPAGAPFAKGLATDSPPANTPGADGAASEASRQPEPASLEGEALALDAEEESGPIVLSYRGDDRSLRIDADIDGPELGERFNMILDTGATFSTLSRQALSRVGISVAPDAPWVELQTAGGRIEAPLVLVDAVWLGNFQVEWITVAVCEDCSSPPVAGLLGLNVLQRFRVAIDHDRRRIELHRREHDFDRRLDIGHWLDVESRITRSWNGRVEVELQGRNRARQAIRTAVIDLDCSGEGFAIELGPIPAGGEASTRAELPRGTDCRQQKLTLSRAHWVEDRFDGQ